MKKRVNLQFSFFMFFLFFVIYLSAAEISNPVLYSDADLNTAKEIVKKMTLAEKIDYLSGRGMGTKGFEKLGISQVEFADSTTGIRGSANHTAFPASIAMAATWNEVLMGEIGKAIADEALSDNIKVLLGPGMNVYRVPQNGRNFEYFGEDPYLISQLTSAYIKAVQNQGVIATAKHFLANNQDYDRHRRNSIVSERALREIFMPAFQSAVHEAGVKAIMTSYNPINGIHASENYYLLNDILKGEWGFKGIIMSDWSSTYSSIPVFKSGMDLEMPHGKWINPGMLSGAFKSGELSESDLNERVAKMIAIFIACDAFKKTSAAFDIEKNNEIAKRTAQESIVLLKNDRQLLPLNPAKIRSIAIVGPNAMKTPVSGGGAAYVKGNRRDQFFESFKTMSESYGIKVDYFRTCEIETLKENSKIDKNWKGARHPGTYETPVSPDYLALTTCLNWKADFFNGKVILGKPVETRYVEQINSSADKNFLLSVLAQKSYSVRFTTTFTPSQSGSYYFLLEGGKKSRFYINSNRAINNSGTCERQLTAGTSYQLKVEFSDCSMKDKILFGIDSGLTTAQRAAAIEKAASYDAVIVCAGFDSRTECEGRDRPFELFEEQEKLIKELSALNNNVIVILNAGGGVQMQPWVNDVSAILHGWYLGQNAGTPMSEILYGKVNPSGKLPISIEKRWEDNSAFGSYNPENPDPFCTKEYFNGYAWRVHDILPELYNEGVFVGYRNLDSKNIEPQFPFGHGLSYTTFEYSGINLSSKTIKKDDILTVTFTVSNTGKTAGMETVQLYLADPSSTLPRPPKELKGFKKILLNPQESSKITMQISKKDLSYYNDEMREWIAEDGEFEILIGSSSRDIKLKEKFILAE